MTAQGNDGRPAFDISPTAAIFLASVLGLFLEMALIRWVSCEIRVFAYLKNLVLIACFLGFGAGLFRARARSMLTSAIFALLLLVLVIRLPWQALLDFGPRRVTPILAELSGMMLFSAMGTEARAFEAAPGLLFAMAWSAGLFFVIAFIMVPFGQVTGRAIADLEDRPLWAYSLNVAGSLAGILLFTLVCAAGLPPILWFVPVALAAILLTSVPAARRWLLALSVALVLCLLPDDPPQQQTFWSSYQKLQLTDGKTIEVNNIGYQGMLLMGPAYDPNNIDRFNLPYHPRTPGRVLVVGAGSGNDAASALMGGATSVTAVEIDPVIYRIGRLLHPQQPYSDPRVTVVVDDARHFLKTTDEVFDLVVFSHLDSHTLLSSFTNVRLDNYIYTVEAFEEARAHLAPGGLVFVSFFAEQPYITTRLAHNLTLAFDHAPISMEGSRAPEVQDEWRNVAFFTGEPDAMVGIEDTLRQVFGFEIIDPDIDTVRPSTDAWPFLPLERPHVPPIMLLISGVILAMAATLAWRVRPPGAAFDGKVFWLGAAFMLLEVHNVSRLALVFGTTWQVNAWVIGVILSLILVANYVVSRLRQRGIRPGRWAIAGLFVSLAVAWAVPLDWFLASSRLLGGLAATLLLTTPLFFAGLAFADAFAESPAPGFALGWNVLGAVVGGMTENLSYIWGIPALVPMAAVFYAAAFLWPMRYGKAGSRPISGG
jgi:hypothetical protein